jgi:tRNA(Ile)-lysidine synthase
MSLTIKEVLINQVRATINEHHLFDNVSRAMIAFSAGPDSVCLLDVLHNIYSPRMEFELVYVNHGLRREKALMREEAKVRTYAARYGVKCKILNIKVSKKKLGIEGSARVARYDALKAYLSVTGSQRIVLGHNLDDFVETFLLNMLRGSGMRGLRSIPVKRLPFVRPLIDCKKKDILSYLKARRLSYMIDKTNLSLDYRRNLLRLKVLPILEAINPEIHQTIKKEAQILKCDDEFLLEKAERVYDKAARIEKDCILLDMTTLMRYNSPIVIRVVMKAIEKVSGNLDGFESKHYHAVISLTSKEHSKKINLPKGIYAQREPESIVIGQVKRSKCIKVPVDLNKRSVSIGDQTLRIRVERGYGTHRLRENCEVFDLSDLRLPLFVRNRKPGDWIETKVGRKKLKKIYSERRIVPRKRGDTLLVCDQKGILWVAGVARAYRGFVNEKTEEILVVEFERTD